MPRICKLCGLRRALRTRRKYCVICYERYIHGSATVELPPGHPFTEERRRRIERMRDRAARGYPVCEPVQPDLS